MSRKITFKQLAEFFNDHARKLSSDNKDKTARFRASAYARAGYLLESEPNKLATIDNINNSKLTSHMKEVAINKVKSKHRSRSKSKSKPSKSKPVSRSDLTQIMGIGNERAKLLLDAGVKSISQLTSKKYASMLPEETKLFLAMKPDQKIPHEHIAKLEPYITGLSDDNLKIHIVGSYRRKKPFSSDIDCMIVSDDVNAIDTFTNKLTNTLDGKVYPYSKGPDKLSTIINLQHILKSKKPVVYKLDAFRTNKIDEIPMLLYSTGSKEFNVNMRGIAKKKGYLLNQKGLFKDKKLVPGLTSEQDYFTILNMPYKQPSER